MDTKYIINLPDWVFVLWGVFGCIGLWKVLDWVWETIREWRESRG